MAKPKKIGGRIQATQFQNRKLAAFLGFLITSVTNEEIRSYVSLFYRIDEQNIKEFLATEFCAFFLPFFVPEVQQFNLETIYPNGFFVLEQLTLSSYTFYIKTLFTSYPQLKILPQERLIDFLIDLIDYMGLITKGTLSTEQMNQLREATRKEIYG